MSNFNITKAESVLHTLLSTKLEKSQDGTQLFVGTSEQFDQISSEQNLIQIPVTLDSNKNALNNMNWHTAIDGAIYMHSSDDSEQFSQFTEQIIWTENISSTAQPPLENLIANVCGSQTIVDLKQVKAEEKLFIKSESAIDNQNNQSKLENNLAEVKDRLKQGCDCRESCYRGLNAETVYRHRLNIAELTKNEHDMYLMGLTMACIADPTQTSRHKERSRLRASYVYRGRRVCLDAFLYLENVTHYQLKRIRKHVMMHGVAPRVHGNIGKKPYNTFSLEIYQHATKFLKQYLETNLAAKDTSARTLIIQGDTRKNIYDNYLECGQLLEPNVKLMGYSTFRHFLKEQFPNIKFAKLEKKESTKNEVKHKVRDDSYKNKDIMVEEAELKEFQESTLIESDLQSIPIVVSEDNIHLQNVHVLTQDNQSYIVAQMQPHILENSLDEDTIYTNTNII